MGLIEDFWGDEHPYPNLGLKGALNAAFQKQEDKDARNEDGDDDDGDELHLPPLTGGFPILGHIPIDIGSSGTAPVSHAEAEAWATADAPTGRGRNSCSVYSGPTRILTVDLLPTSMQDGAMHVAFPMWHGAPVLVTWYAIHDASASVMLTGYITQPMQMQTNDRLHINIRVT